MATTIKEEGLDPCPPPPQSSEESPCLAPDLRSRPSETQVQAILQTFRQCSEFLHYQFHKEGADEANHAGPGVPDLGSLGETQERASFGCTLGTST